MSLVIYAIIKRGKLEDLVKHVNAIAKEGWCPHGGVAMSWNPTGNFSGGAMEYAQAVIRYPTLDSPKLDQSDVPTPV